MDDLKDLIWAPYKNTTSSPGTNNNNNNNNNNNINNSNTNLNKPKSQTSSVVGSPNYFVSFENVNQNKTNSGLNNFGSFSSTNNNNNSNNNSATNSNSNFASFFNNTNNNTNGSQSSLNFNSSSSTNNNSSFQGTNLFNLNNNNNNNNNNGKGNAKISSHIPTSQSFNFGSLHKISSSPPNTTNNLSNLGSGNRSFSNSVNDFGSFTSVNHPNSNNGNFFNFNNVPSSHGSTTGLSTNNGTTSSNPLHSHSSFSSTKPSGLNPNTTTSTTNTANLFDDIFSFSTTTPQTNGTNTNSTTKNKSNDLFANFASLTAKKETASFNNSAAASNRSLNSLKEQQDLQNKNNVNKTNQQWNFDLFEKQTSSVGNSFGSFHSFPNLNNISKEPSSSNLSPSNTNNNPTHTGSQSNNNILFEFDVLAQPPAATNPPSKTTTTTTTTTTTNDFANFDSFNTKPSTTDPPKNKTHLTSSNDLFNFDLQPSSTHTNGPRRNSYSNSEYSDGSEDALTGLNDNLIHNDKSFPLEDKTHFQRVNIEKLLEMGFSEKDAIEAVRQTDNNLEEAVQYVLNKQSQKKGSVSSSVSSLNNTSTTTNNNANNLPNGSTTPSHQHSSSSAAETLNSKAGSTHSPSPSRFASFYSKASDIFKQSKDRLNSLVNSDAASEVSNPYDSKDQLNGSRDSNLNRTDKSTTTTSTTAKKNKGKDESKRFSIDYFYKEDQDSGEDRDDDLVLPNPDDFTRYKHIAIDEDDHSSVASNEPPDLVGSVSVASKPSSTQNPPSNVPPPNSSSTVSTAAEATAETKKKKKKVRESAYSSSESSGEDDDDQGIYNIPDDFVRYQHLEVSPNSNPTSPLAAATATHEKSSPDQDQDQDQDIDKLMEVFSTATLATVPTPSKNEDGFEAAPVMAVGTTTEKDLMSAGVYATPEQQQTAQRYREQGNDFFKKGQFSEAAQYYTQAIQALPEGHRDLIVLYNNRSIAYIKTGHYKECVQDCDTVQSMDSTDVKSLIRRATAYEHLEKWKLALADYQKIQTLDHSYTLAHQAITRCRKALHMEARESQGTSTTTFPAPSSRSASGTSTPNSKFNRQLQADILQAQQRAMEKLKRNEEKQQAEENERFRLKDQIDAKIMTWSKGKENNIRALIASMDMVLWPELNWKNMNLADLITPQKVKIGYMKAIAKVHPDKIRNEETVEHKMIATSVFGILNTAWDSFKEQNGL